MVRKPFLADLTLLAITFVWGATFVVVQNAIALLEPNTFNALRFLVAALFLLLIMSIASPQSWRFFSPRLIAVGMFIGLFLFAGYAFQTVGLLYTTASKSGFITGLSVVIVPVLSFLLLRERLKWSAIIGVILAVLGLYLLTVGVSLYFNFGDLLTLACAFCFALQIVMTGKFAPQYAVMPLAIVELTAVGLFSLLTALGLENWQLALDPAIMLNPDVAWGLFITAVPGTALAFWAQTALQKHLAATRVALIYAMEPVFAALTAYLWIHEILTTRQLLGCACILLGMLLAELPLGSWLQSWQRHWLARTDKNK